MKDVYNYIKNDIGLNKNDRIVIGVSGGPDSMALLYLLNILKIEMNLVLICAHVNHNIRKESEIEQITINKYCKENNIIFESIKIKKWGEDNFQNEARTTRYNFFDEIANNYEAKFLMTAHHADDLMETILMRIVRGSTLKGYGGFAKVVEKDNYKIIRPLITKTKIEILDYIKQNNITYFNDSSNDEDHYTRNRYRHVVTPFLKSEDINVHSKFLKYSKALLEASDYIDAEAKKVFNKVVQKGIINIGPFRELEKIIQEKIIYNILEKIYSDDLLIVSDVHVSLIINLINSKKANSIVHLPNNVVVIKSYNEVSFDYDDFFDDVFEIEIIDRINLPNGKNIDKINCCEEVSNNIIRLDSKEICLPLYTRNRKDGDKMKVKGLNGTKKISDIFIDNKIKKNERNIWPVVLDAKNNIVWVPGLKKSIFDKEIDEEYDIILKYY